MNSQVTPAIEQRSIEPMTANLHVLTDRQITLLLRAAGYSDEDIAAMDREAMEAAISANTGEGASDGSIGFPPAPEGESVIYALLRHEGYTDEQIAEMDDEEREAVVEATSRDVVDEALHRAGYDDAEIAAMTDEEKMANVDVNDVMVYEALHEAGFSDEDINRMSDDEKADALDQQTLMENEALREAGYYPEDLSPGGRQEALDQLTEYADDYMVLGETFGLSELNEPEQAEDSDLDEFDVDEMDDPEDEPDDPETDLEEQPATFDDEPLIAPPLDDESDEELDGAGYEIKFEEGTVTVDSHTVTEESGPDGWGREEVTEAHGASKDGKIVWESDETTESSVGSDGAHRSANQVYVEESPFGLRESERSSDIDVDARGANWDSEQHESMVGNDGSISTDDKERHTSVDESGVDYSRTRDHLDLAADGSSHQTGDRSEVSVGVEGGHIGHGRTNLTTDAEGNVTGTDADIDLSADVSGVRFADDIDSTERGGLLGDRGVSRHVDVDLGLDGLDTAGTGTITLGGHTVEVGHDVSVGPRGVSVEIGGQDLGLDLPDLSGEFSGRSPIDVYNVPTSSEEAAEVVDPFIPDDAPPPPEDVAEVVVDVVTEAADDVSPPPPPEDVTDVFEDGADAAGDAMGGIFG